MIIDLDYKHIVGEQGRVLFYHGMTDRRRQVAGSQERTLGHCIFVSLMEDMTQ